MQCTAVGMAIAVTNMMKMTVPPPPTAIPAMMPIEGETVCLVVVVSDSLAVVMGWRGDGVIMEAGMVARTVCLVVVLSDSLAVMMGWRRDGGMVAGTVCLAVVVSDSSAVVMGWRGIVEWLQGQFVW